MRAEFDVHVLNDVGLDKATAIAEAFSRLLDHLDNLIPPGRERVLVVTKLQEAEFFAERAMATAPENQATRSGAV